MKVSFTDVSHSSQSLINVNSVTTHDWAIGIAIAPIRLNLGQIFDFPDCYIFAFSFKQ